MRRSDEETASESLPAGFTPSKRTSDWIPMTGAPTRTESVRNLHKFGDDYFGDQDQFQIEPQPIPQPLVQSEKPKPENKVVGDIISGRIPGGHNPFGVVGNKPVASGTIGDGSNLVVSSVIKFSR